MGLYGQAGFQLGADFSLSLLRSTLVRHVGSKDVGFVLLSLGCNETLLLLFSFAHIGVEERLGGERILQY